METVSRPMHSLTDFLEPLLEQLPLALVVTDPETHDVRWANRAFGELTGFAEDEIVGAAPPYPWWVEPPRLAGGEEEPPGDEHVRIEGFYRCKDGHLVPVEIERFAVRDRQGEVVAHARLTRDVTEHRRYEQQFLQTGKLAAIGELAAGVAHEINNPLFAILGLVEFLLRDADEGTKSHERLALVQETALEIKEIVRALLDFAREGSDEQLLVPLRDVTAQTLELVRRTHAAKDVELVERYADEPLRVRASPNQLKQVILNIVTNARQAMPTGGTLTVGLERDGDTGVISVSDTGGGIDAAALTRIFEPFYTTKRTIGGTGLGLSVSLGIIEAHGGTIAAESEPGRGTVFRVRLPLEDA
jgi:two-component system, NtrC family, sensor kinase